MGDDDVYEVGETYEGPFVKVRITGESCENWVIKKLDSDRGEELYPKARFAECYRRVPPLPQPGERWIVKRARPADRPVRVLWTDGHLVAHLWAYTADAGNVRTVEDFVTHYRPYTEGN